MKSGAVTSARYADGSSSSSTEVDRASSSVIVIPLALDGSDMAGMPGMLTCFQVGLVNLVRNRVRTSQRFLYFVGLLQEICHVIVHGLVMTWGKS